MRSEMIIVTGKYRIKKKADVNDFRKSVSMNGAVMQILGNDGEVYEIYCSMSGKITVVKFFSETPIGWVTIAVAKDDCDNYNMTVEDFLWKERRGVNAWLAGKRVTRKADGSFEMVKRYW